MVWYEIIQLSSGLGNFLHMEPPLTSISIHNFGHEESIIADTHVMAWDKADEN